MLLSEEELRFNHTFKQGYDTSCGIAATATLLNKYWDIPISEAEMYQDMIADRFDEHEAVYTINFMTIAEYVQQKGIQARAYKMDWLTLEDTLNQGFAPIIIHYDKPRTHFALLTHIHENCAFVADPAKGFELVERDRFEKNYSGHALLSASRAARKNTERLEQIELVETKRLERLQSLSRMRSRW